MEEEGLYTEDEEEMNGSVADLYIRMEFCEHRTFRKLIESGDIVRDRFRMSMQFRRLVESVNYFHKMSFTHQDLKVKLIFLRYRSLIFSLSLTVLVRKCVF